ncbi:MAG: cytochrome c oxidase accessory protein CcoG [Sandaracinaceae bacterium]|nr:cytochrome c oxidase accessory protein CcoG [Sandaracinaceae bacterium]
MSSKVHLKIAEPASSLRNDGTRNHVHPADVHGRFVRARYVVFALLIAVWAALPWIPIAGRPALFLDVEHRRFYLFGGTFNAQDFWLVFFLVTGVGFALIVVTAFLGRVWCGWACPQTVFMEGVFRRIERLVEGPRNERLRRNAGPWSFDKIWRKTVKHVLFVIAALFVSHIFLSFFVSMPSLLQMVQRSPAEHPTAFAWMAAVSVILYGNFAWFREQLCLIVCPYGRLQSVLTDRDSLVVGYDERRGEPRGKAKDTNAGDCVDCGRCVVVCPTGIDIRNGLQLDCIGCTACIDACDEVMDKLGRPRGLVRYDSLNGLEREPKRIWRARVALYAVLLVAGVVVAGIALRSHTPFEANLLRLRGAPYLVQDGSVHNLFQLHLINKGPERTAFVLEPVDAPGQSFRISPARVELDSLADRQISVVVQVPLAQFRLGRSARVRVRREADPPDQAEELTGPLLGPE